MEKKIFKMLVIFGVRWNQTTGKIFGLPSKLDGSNA